MTQRKIRLENVIDYIIGDDTKNQEIDDFKDKPFYCWDTSYLGRGNCCFNHLVGLPFESKSGDIKPSYGEHVIDVI